MSNTAIMADIRDKIRDIILDGCMSREEACEMVLSLLSDESDKRHEKWFPGAKVRVVSNTSGHEFEIGCAVTVLDHDPNVGGYFCSDENGRNRWLMAEEGKLIHG